MYWFMSWSNKTLNLKPTSSLPPCPPPPPGASIQTSAPLSLNSKLEEKLDHPAEGVGDHPAARGHRQPVQSSWWRWGHRPSPRCSWSRWSLTSAAGAELEKNGRMCRFLKWKNISSKYFYRLRPGFFESFSEFYSRIKNQMTMNVTKNLCYSHS